MAMFAVVRIVLMASVVAIARTILPTSGSRGTLTGLEVAGE